MDGSAELVRQISRHGAEYDALIQRGIPRRMLRRAWTAVGGDANAAMDFVRENFDAPSSFWDPVVQAPSSRRPTVEESSRPLPIDRLHAGLARPEVWRALGLSQTEARELQRGHGGTQRAAREHDDDGAILARSLSVGARARRRVAWPSELPAPPQTEGSTLTAPSDAFATYLQPQPTAQALALARTTDVAAPNTVVGNANLSLAERSAKLRSQPEADATLLASLEKSLLKSQFVRTLYPGDVVDVNIAGAFLIEVLQVLEDDHGLELAEDGQSLTLSEELQQQMTERLQRRAHARRGPRPGYWAPRQRGPFLQRPHPFARRVARDQLGGENFQMVSFYRTIHLAGAHRRREPHLWRWYSQEASESSSADASESSSEDASESSSADASESSSEDASESSSADASESSSEDASESSSEDVSKSAFNLESTFEDAKAEPGSTAELLQGVPEEEHPYVLVDRLEDVIRGKLAEARSTDLSPELGSLLRCSSIVDVVDQLGAVLLGRASSRTLQRWEPDHEECVALRKLLDDHSSEAAQAQPQPEPELELEPEPEAADGKFVQCFSAELADAARKLLRQQEETERLRTSFLPEPCWVSATVRSVRNLALLFEGLPQGTGDEEEGASIVIEIDTMDIETTECIQTQIQRLRRLLQPLVTMGEEIAEIMEEVDDYLNNEMEHYSAPDPEDFVRRGRADMTLSQRIEEFLKPAHTHVPNALAALQVGDSVEVFVDAAPDEKNSDGSSQADVPFAGGRGRGRGRGRPRGRGRGRGRVRGHGIHRAGGAVPQPRWVCGTVSERTMCNTTGSDLIWIDLPSDIKPKKRESENYGFMAHRHIRYARQVSQLEPAKVQLPTCAEDDANTRVGFVVASLDISGFHERSRACRPIAVHHPELLVGQTIIVEKSQDEDDGDIHFDSHDATRPYPVTVLAYLPELGEHGQHLLQNLKHRNKSVVELAYLGQRRFYTSGYGSTIEDRGVVAAAGTHTAECLACTERVDASGMATYCFAHYHVTGDGTQKLGARHRMELCRECFKGYCSREIATGKLHVRCPSCPRALQTREIENFVSEKDYNRLIKRIRAAEKEHGDDDGVAAELIAAGLEVRMCPRCGTRIEKNEGCDSMDCYLCGHNFEWHEAKRVKAKMERCE